VSPCVTEYLPVRVADRRNGAPDPNIIRHKRGQHDFCVDQHLGLPASRLPAAMYTPFPISAPLTAPAARHARVAPPGAHPVADADAKAVAEDLLLDLGTFLLAGARPSAVPRAYAVQRVSVVYR
jgi:hypothetical protein